MRDVPHFTRLRPGGASVGACAAASLFASFLPPSLSVECLNGSIGLAASIQHRRFPLPAALCLRSGTFKGCCVALVEVCYKSESLTFSMQPAKRIVDAQRLHARLPRRGCLASLLAPGTKLQLLDAPAPARANAAATAASDPSDCTGIACCAPAAPVCRPAPASGRSGSRCTSPLPVSARAVPLF